MMINPYFIQDNPMGTSDPEPEPRLTESKRTCQEAHPCHDCRWLYWDWMGLHDGAAVKVPYCFCAGDILVLAVARCNYWEKGSLVR